VLVDRLVLSLFLFHILTAGNHWERNGTANGNRAAAPSIIICTRTAQQQPIENLGELCEAKRKRRPKLKDWAKDGFHGSGSRGTDFARLRHESLDGDVNHVQKPRPPSSQASSTPQQPPMFKIDKI
jgi:hypothetical protein